MKSRSRRALLVASTGGHLSQLHRLRPRLASIADEVEWLTFDTPQSRSLLDGETVHWAHYTAPRNYAGVARNVPLGMRLVESGRFDTVISTGSAVALSVLPIATLRGLRTIYVESAARSTGPSLTGRLLARFPNVELFTQYPVWADRRWQYAGSVFDGYEAQSQTAGRLTDASVVVTVGTIPYGFRSLIERVNSLLPEKSDVLWQTGVTDVSGLSMTGTDSVPARDLERQIARADLVVCHAGVGSALTALNAGKCPILVPRRAQRDEHIDDHQEQIAQELDRRGLAIAREVGELGVDDLFSAMSRTIVRQDTIGSLAIAA